MNTLHTAPSLGLTKRERDSYSIGGLVRAICERDQPRVNDYAVLSSRVAELTGASPLVQGHYLPADLLGVPLQRDMTTTAGATGGYMVGVETLGYSAALSRASLVDRLGVTQLRGLRDDAAIVTQSTHHQVLWQGGEGTAVAPTQGDLGMISLMPKTCIAMITASRQLLTQAGAGGRQFIDAQLGVAVAETIDAAIVNGSGVSGEPLGILSMEGVDTRTGASFDIAAAAAMLKVAEGYRADDSVAWLAGVDAAEVLRKRPKVAGGERMLAEDNMMLGRPFHVSRAMPAAGLICAPWSSVMLASWGAPLLKVDPSMYFDSGAVRIGLFAMLDVAVERPSLLAVATAVS
jgi:HK97 family phage major capsid protein